MGTPGRLMLAAVALSAVACGASPEATPELVGVPYPAEEVREEAEAVLAEPEDDPVEAVEGPTPNSEPDPDLPSPSDARAFIEERLSDDVRDHDHLLIDLEGDGIAEVLLAVLTSDGRAEVEVGRWNGSAYALARTHEAGPADVLGRLRVGSADAHRSRAILLALRSGDGLRVVVWENGQDGRLQSPAGCPLAGEAGSLRLPTGERVTLACEPGEGVALAWHDGAFRPVELDAGEVEELVDGRSDGLGG